ncbi:MAG TPA: fumarylacetoacetate hydrolase family protein, partial [Chitinophagaceae bacterium]
MKIAYFRQKNKLVPGILTDKGIIDLCSVSDYFRKREMPDSPLTNDEIGELRKAVESAVDQPGKLLREISLEIGPCVPKPSKIICIGLNYRKHAEESGMPIPLEPIVFTKYSNTLVNYEQDVYLGTEGEHFDYEVELGVVIGERCKNISKEDALNHVFGYCVANDLSCRDLQFKSSQWLLGKSLDQFLPLGKYIVTADEVGDPQRLK